MAAKKKTRRRKPTATHGVVPGLRELLQPLAKLVPDPENAKEHPEHQVAQLMASLEERGQYLPLVVQARTMRVVVGNARLEAARRLGWTHVAALVLDRSREQLLRLAIGDNRLAEGGDWNYERLTELLEEVGGATDEELAALAFTRDEVDAIVLHTTWPGSGMPAGTRTTPKVAHGKGLALLTLEVAEGVDVEEVKEAVARALSPFDGKARIK